MQIGWWNWPPIHQGGNISLQENDGVEFILLLNSIKRDGELLIRL